MLPLAAIIQCVLCLIPNCPDQLCLLVSRLDVARVSRWHTSQSFTDSRRVWLSSRNRSKVEGPQKAADADEHRSLRHMHTLTDTAASAKGEKVTFFWIDVRGCFSEAEKVVLVPIRLETTRIWVADRV